MEWVNTDDSYSAKYEYDFFGVDEDQFDGSRRCTYSLFSNNLPADYGVEGKWYKGRVE